MRENEHGQFRSLGRLTAAALAALLGVLIFGGFAAALPKPGGALSGVPNKDKDQEFTRVYQHTYDEVFQASLETIERMGLFLTDKDKDKGTISGNGAYDFGGNRPRKGTFDIHIEALNTKPETRVTINAKFRGMKDWAFPERFLSELQKVLSTYK